MVPVDPAGAIIEITDPESPIYGTKVEIQEGALPGSDPVTISIGYRDELPGPLATGFFAVSKVVTLTKNSSYRFNVPISITIPYTADQLLPDDSPIALYWDPIYKQYGPLRIRNIDKTNKTITFSTTHFTDIVAIGQQSVKDLFAKQYNNEFTPHEDGFSLGNIGAHGSCFGMANYAAWYFTAKKEAAVKAYLLDTI